jgi:L-rhamnose mutarotase
MNLTLKMEQFNPIYLFFRDTKKNNLMDGNFTKLIYTHDLFTMNGIFLTIPIFIHTINVVSNKLIVNYTCLKSEEVQFIEKQILDSGVVECEIFRFANRLMMKLVVDAGFTFEKKEALDAGNERVQQWEALMDQFQSKIDSGTNGKWQLMTSIYVLKA